MKRIIALDFGTKRTGVAVTDPMQIIASGLDTVLTKDLISFLKSYLNSEPVSTIVLGEPKQMDNTPSESEAAIKELILTLEAEFTGIKIARQDERFTSKMAVQAMVAGGMKKKKRQEKGRIDQISATLILQAYLNRIS
ncbi:Holliday junction resolvase RuvX [Flavobacteriaceae bacterium]|nr:Holliday junction resolvase RuvX [Flavobacteriaceae bacterium]